jgi:hypothetical protein
MSRPLSGCDFLQGEQKDSDVLAKQIDGIAGIFPKAIPPGGRLTIPREFLVLGSVNGLRHQLDFVLHLDLRCEGQAALTHGNTQVRCLLRC